jgi:hypothetical protein
MNFGESGFENKECNKSNKLQRFSQVYIRII